MGSFAPKGHMRVNARSPRAAAICDMCGFQYNRETLRPQMIYAGNALIWGGFLHCPTCLDVPNWRRQPPMVLPADPEPVIYPRKEPPG